ncbi:MAG TPA: nuclear transport factor 2 family protein [Solirubrobacterales bacterium]|nr:nuclear transport factor 2 family protein [Solirubrobacterales bacterium]
MSSSQETQRFLRDGYAALSRADIDAWLQGVHADAELHELSEVPDAAIYRGPDGFRAWAEAALELVEEWEWEPEEFVVDHGDVAVVRVNLRIRGRGGVPVEQTVFHVFRLRDAMLVEIRAYLDQRQALKAAGLSE